ncbi:hypothetical protein D3C87_1581210 [compost metagenome]
MGRAVVDQQHTSNVPSCAGHWVLPAAKLRGRPQAGGHSRRGVPGVLCTRHSPSFAVSTKPQTSALSHAFRPTVIARSLPSNGFSLVLSPVRCAVPSWHFFFAPAFHLLRQTTRTERLFRCVRTPSRTPRLSRAGCCPLRFPPRSRPAAVEAAVALPFPRSAAPRRRPRPARPTKARAARRR